MDLGSAARRAFPTVRTSAEISAKIARDGSSAPSSFAPLFFFGLRQVRASRGRSIFAAAWQILVLAAGAKIEFGLET